MELPGNRERGCALPENYSSVGRPLSASVRDERQGDLRRQSKDNLVDDKNPKFRKLANRWFTGLI
jgi:hypothetical protein